MPFTLFPYKTIIFTLNLLKIHLKDILYVFLGLFATTPCLVFSIFLTLPFILCRLLIALLLSKFYRTGHGYREMVSPGFTTAYALEYMSSVWKGEPSRNTALSRTLIEGHIPFDFWKDKIESGWINAKTDKNFQKFPMLRQYVHSCLGYCYWREDFDFDLSSHIHYHKIKETDDVDQYTSDLFEKLMNIPFKKNRTPWDVYIIHGWRQVSTFEKNNLNANTEVTVLVTRTHHALGDGKTFASLLIKDLYGNFVKDCRKQDASEPNTSIGSQNSDKISLSLIKAAVNLIWDLGFITYFMLLKVYANTKLHKSNCPSFVHQISPLISMDSIKNIRNRFQVNFSSVLVSSLAAAIADCVNDDKINKFLLAAPRPLPGHPVDKMVNHLTGAAYNLPLSVNMHPLQRLKECDKVLKMVNESLFSIYVFPVLLYFLSFHIAPIAKFGFKSRLFGVSFSNNVGSDVRVHVAGKNKILEINAVVGTFDGSTGIMLVMSSYADQFRIHAIANSSALNKRELKLFMERVISEIENLSILTQSCCNNK